MYDILLLMNAGSNAKTSPMMGYSNGINALRSCSDYISTKKVAQSLKFVGPSIAEFIAEASRVDIPKKTSCCTRRTS